LTKPVSLNTIVKLQITEKERPLDPRHIYKIRT